MTKADVLIVGAGLAGLSCARYLSANGVSVQLLDGSDAVGGRVRTDLVDGFRLDRGFQVLLTAYPEAKRFLDYQALDLQSFAPGARVRVASEFHAVADPLRDPSRLVSSLRAPIGTFGDKLRVARQRLGRAMRSVESVLENAPDVTTREDLTDQGFSDEMIERFWGPLLAGITLEPHLGGSAKVSRFVMACLTKGSAAIPRRGMQRIPEQMVQALPSGTVRLGVRVEAVRDGAVDTSDGTIDAGWIVVATDQPSAADLVDRDPNPGKGVTSFVFAADQPPLTGKWIVLGDDAGPVNNLAVMSEVSPDYAPDGTAQIVAQVLGTTLGEDAVRGHLASWFGDSVERWETIDVRPIPFAQPTQRPPFDGTGPSLVADTVVVAGDHTTTASINGALRSGRLAAEIVASSAGYAAP